MDHCIENGHSAESGWGYSASKSSDCQSTLLGQEPRDTQRHRDIFERRKLIGESRNINQFSNSPLVSKTRQLAPKAVAVKCIATISPRRHVIKDMECLKGSIGNRSKMPLDNLQCTKCLVPVVNSDLCRVCRVEIHYCCPLVYWYLGFNLLLHRTCCRWLQD